MSLELTVRGKTYKVEVDYRGHFTAQLDPEEGTRQLQADTLKGLEQKLMAATRARSAKVEVRLKRLGRKPESGVYSRRSYSYGRRSSEEEKWEVVEVTVRGVNAHTRNLMVTWPDGSKSDDENSRYDSSCSYFPLTMPDEEILSRRRAIDESEAWIEANKVDAHDLADAAVKKALGDTDG